MRTVLFLLALAAFPAQAQSIFGREPNLGQLPPEILFFQRSSYNSLLFTRDSMRSGRGFEVQIDNTSPQATPTLIDPLATNYNYYLGNNSSKWITGVKHYRSVHLPNAYPGINASWIGSFSDGFERLAFNLAPGADPSLIRIRIKNAGAHSFEGPGGIWFTGGPLPGVFLAKVEASQGNPDAPLAATLRLANSDTVTISAPNLDSTRPTEFVISFPNYQSSFGRPESLPWKSTDGNRYALSSIEDTFSNTAYDTVVARFAEDGNPLWVTILGGSNSDFIGDLTPIADGIVVTGPTFSQDFPVSTNAPAPKALAANVPFFAFINRDSGLLRSSTYGPFSTNSAAGFPITASARDIIFGGSSEIPNAPLPNFNSGFLLRWRPIENLFIYNVSLPDPVRNLTSDPSGATYYATYSSNASPTRLRVAAANEAGQPLGRPSEYLIAGNQSQLSEIKLLPAPGLSVYAFFSLRDSLSITGNLAHFSLLNGTTVFVRPLNSVTQLSAFDLNAAGEPRLLTFTGASEISPTSPSATLVAPCLNSAYYARFSPTGSLLYASYVQQSSFNFNAPEPSATKPSLSCAVPTAGRRPVGALIPGQMVTLTGGNFGPAEAIYSTLGPDGKFPATLNGYSVRIGDTNAPIFAVARGLIAVQIPFETKSPTSISITGPDAPADILPITISTRNTTLFDTGDTANPTRLPALAALNQDGTVNSKSNPAILGSIVSVFGSGLDLPAAPLTTGGLNPLNTIYANPLYNRGFNCIPVYIGSAPGLSTAVFQANLQLISNYAGTGTRPLPLSFALGENPRSIFLPTPSAIVWVKDE